MARVFSRAYVTQEGFHPECFIVHSVADISGHVDSKTKNWPHLGIAQYYQFHILMELATVDNPSPRVVVQGRQSTAGDEIFRGLFEHAFHACDDLTPIFEDPDDKIDWSTIGPSQRKEKVEATLAQFKSTMQKGYVQWSYSADEFDSLVASWNLLDSEEPIPFHWLNGVTLTTESPLSYKLWPCKKGQSVVAAGAPLSPVTEIRQAMARTLSTTSLAVRGPGLVLVPGDHNPFDPIEVADRNKNNPWSTTSLAVRGPGLVLVPGDHNPFDPIEVADRNKNNPWRDFAVGMVVLVRPPSDEREAKTDGFYIGRLVDAPEAAPDEIREEDDFYVGIHWWGRKRNSQELSWNDWTVKWEAQTGASGLSIQAISIKTVGAEVQMNADGGFRKLIQNLKYINYYRHLWFGLSHSEWKRT
jgi:hypothetical protein